jgi:hypothetical protein
MKVRTLLTLTGIVSSILGACVVYLILSVPNDLRADALLRQAREDLAGGRNVEARQSLLRIVQQFPRTDAAAAATAALMSVAQKERDDLARAIGVLRQQNEQQTVQLAALQLTINELRSAPAKTVTVTAPAAAPAKPAVKPAPKPAPKKKAPVKKSTRRTRRRG